MASCAFTLRQRAGAAFLELPIFVWGSLRPSLRRSPEDPAWLCVRKRSARLLAGPGQGAVRYDWQRFAARQE